MRGGGGQGGQGARVKCSEGGKGFAHGEERAGHEEGRRHSERICFCGISWAGRDPRHGELFELGRCCKARNRRAPCAERGEARQLGEEGAGSEENESRDEASREHETSRAHGGPQPRWHPACCDSPTSHGPSRFRLRSNGLQAVPMRTWRRPAAMIGVLGSLSRHWARWLRVRGVTKAFGLVTLLAGGCMLSLQRPVQACNISGRCGHFAIAETRAGL